MSKTALWTIGAIVVAGLMLYTALVVPALPPARRTPHRIQAAVNVVAQVEFPVSSTRAPAK